VTFHAAVDAAGTDGDLQSCAFPLSLIQHPQYNQPVFWGTNNFTFTAATASAAVLNVVVSFVNGGGDGFMGEWGHVAARMAVQRAPAAPADRPEERAAQLAHQAAVAAAVDGVFKPAPHAAATHSSAYYSDNSKGQLLVPDDSQPASGFSKKNT
jgi:hypothetical protein